MKILKWSFKKSNNSANKDKELLQKVTPEFINSAYSRRVNELDSLRKYDRGEKTITPLNLSSYIKSI